MKMTLKTNRIVGSYYMDRGEKTTLKGDSNLGVGERVTVFELVDEVVEVALGKFGHVDVMQDVHQGHEGDVDHVGVTLGQVCSEGVLVEVLQNHVCALINRV